MLVEHGISGRRRQLVIVGALGILLVLGSWAVLGGRADTTGAGAPTTTAPRAPSETTTTATTLPVPGLPPEPPVSATEPPPEEQGPGSDIVGWDRVELPDGLGPLGAATAWTGRELLVWGRRDPAPSDEPAVVPGRAFDPFEETWRTLPHLPLTPREDVTSVWTGTEMIVCCSDDGATFAYEEERGEWRRSADLPETVHSSSDDVAAVWTGTEMLLVTPTGVAALDPAADRWRTFADPPTFLGRANRVVWTGEQAVVWPAPYSRTTAIGMSLDPATGTWTELPEPTVRPAIPDLIWTGTDLVLVGGLPGASSDAPSERLVSARFDPAAWRWHPIPDALPEPISGEWNLGSHTVVVDGPNVLLSTGYLGSGLDPDAPLLYRLGPDRLRWTLLGRSPAPPGAEPLELAIGPAFLTADHLIVTARPPRSITRPALTTTDHSGITVTHPEAEWFVSRGDLAPAGLSFRFALSTSPPIQGGGGTGCGQHPVPALEAMTPDDVFLHVEELGPLGPGATDFEPRPVDFGAVLATLDTNSDVWLCLSEEGRDRLSSLTWFSFEEGGRALYLLAAIGRDTTPERRSTAVGILNSLVVEPA